MTYQHQIDIDPAIPATRPTEAGVETSLREEIARLQRELRDQRIALLTSNEHGDLLEEHLSILSKSLVAEVQTIGREKADLETLVQILMDEGDEAAVEGEKSRIDGLTQVANRRRFDEYLANEWRRHLRTQQPLSLLLCDIDHFKLYNDSYGHRAGDECLRAVAVAISQHCRSNGLVARYGGEEFAIVLPNTSCQAAISVAERLRSFFGAATLPHPASPVCSRVTLSIGAACKTPQTEEASESHSLVEEADRNLYLAKHRGRNQVAHSNEENTGLL